MRRNAHAFAEKKIPQHGIPSALRAEGIFWRFLRELFLLGKIRIEKRAAVHVV
jgi:hypothetical protein